MSSPDSINTGKEIEPHYQYTRPVEGQEEFPSLIGAPETGSPMIMKDQISSAKVEPGQTAIQAPPIDNPNAPIPTRKALKLMAIRKAIQEEAIKEKNVPKADNTGQNVSKGPTASVGQNVSTASNLETSKFTSSGGPGGGGGNDWLKFPNRMGALFIALIDFQTSMSKNRYQDAQNKMVVETAMFKIGMENADLAKELKDIAAQKELVRAVTSFVQAAFTFYQLGSLIQERGKVKEEIFGDQSESSKKIAAQKGKIDQLKQAAGLKGTEFEEQKELEKLTQTDPASAKNIQKEQAKLQTLEDRQWSEFNTESQRSSQITEAKFKAINSLIEGASSIATCLLTKTEGSLEKLKAQNETLQQFWSRLDDSISKSKDDSAQLVDKILQTILQLNSEMKATLSTRG